MAGKRIGKAELEIRVNIIGTYLLNGMSRPEIWQYITSPDSKNQWGISLRTLDRYINLATKAIKESSQIDRNLEIGRSKGRLEILWKKNMSIQDFKAALSVVKETNKLFGLNEPEKLNVKGDYTTQGIDPEGFNRSIETFLQTFGDSLLNKVDE